MTDALKPCPHCQAIPPMLLGKYGYELLHYCQIRGEPGTIKVSIEADAEREVVMLWNTRLIEDALNAEIVLLRLMIRRYGGRSFLSNAEPLEIQQAMDRAMADGGVKDVQAD